MQQILFGFWRRGGIWRRWATIFGLFLLALVGIIVYTRKVSSPPEILPPLHFKWLDLNNVTHLTRCRNSVQGPHLVADEKGQVCNRQDLLGNGCCNSKSNRTERFACTTCQVNKCCRLFEHCIACCLQPHKRKVLEMVLIHAHNSKNPLLRMVTDTFELCLHKCRTSSTSLHRENKYRDSLYKYCYGMDAPRVLNNQHHTDVLR